MDFRDYIRLFRRRWPVMVLIAVVVAAAQVASLSVGRAPVYESRAELLLKETALEQGLVSSDASNTPLLPLRTRINLITSPALCVRASRRLEQSGGPVRAGADDIRSRLTVTTSPDGHTVLVSATGPTREYPMAVANAACEAFQDWTREEATQSYVRARDIRNRQLKKIAEQYDEQTARLRDFVREKLRGHNVRPDLQFERRLAQVLELENQRAALDAQYQAVADQIQRPVPGQPGFELVPETSAGTTVAVQEGIAGTAAAADLRRRASDLQHREATLREKYTDAHPDIISVRAEIAGVAEAIDEEMLSGAEERRIALRRQREELRVRLQRLDEQIRDGWAGMESLQEPMEGYAELVAARGILTAQRRDIMNDLLQLEQREALEGQQDRVTLWHRAEPGTPARPASGANLPLVAIVSLMLGLTGGYVLDLLQSNIRSSADVRTYLDLSTIAAVPHFRGEKIRLLDVALKSPVYELYNKLATFLQATAAEQRARSLVVVSAKAGEGKSTIVSNVAIALAQSGERVILVDSDLRRPVQHQIFGLDNSRGLSSVLAGEMEADRRLAEATGRPAATLDQYLQATPLPTLQVLPSGPVPMNPISLLKSPHLGRLLSEMKQRADVVLFDAPPVLGVIDGAILAGQCDLTVLVMQENGVSRGEAGQFKHALQQTGANLVGVVLNKVTHQPEAYYYYYYHYRGYT